MNENVYFEDNNGHIVVSNQRITIYNETVDVSNIDDFDLENRRSLNSISLSLNDGLKIGTSLVQLVLISPLGRKSAYEPLDLRNRIDQLQLRGIVLALSRAIGERKQNAPHHQPAEAAAAKTPSPFSTPISVTNLPKSLSQIEASVLNLMQDPGEEYQDLNKRFTAAISVLLDGAGIRAMNHPVTAKAIYEYQRVHGHRNTTLGFFGSSGVTIGSVFRPLLPGEVPAFEKFYEQVSQSPLPQILPELEV